MPDDTITAELLLAALQQAASGPEEIQTDAGRVKQFSLADLVAAHKYVSAAQVSNQTNAASGLRFAQLIPGGTVQRGSRGGRSWR
jgi:hypothetical protein